MSIGLKIREVAQVSGFSAATLRYYEEIGLLPVASRTPAGYRMYDQRTLKRLEFIARAKQLGCTLDEIGGLSSAWDGGRCGPVQDQLRQLVASKIAASQSQLVELLTFTSELQQAAVALELHRPEGACDAQCGCVSEPDDVAPPASMAVGVAMSTKPAASGEPAIACTLDAGSMAGRLGDWQSLLAHVDRREAIDGGVRSVFASSVSIDQLARLVTAEQDCCQFFHFAITVDTRGVALEVRAPDEAMPIIESIFGVAS